MAVASALGGFQNWMVHPIRRAAMGQGAGSAAKGMLVLNSQGGRRRVLGAARMPAPVGAGSDTPCFPPAGREWCLRGG